MYRFQPNCTAPAPRDGSQGHYIGGPNVRGTLEILWDCLAIFILCTWTIQHLNIPEQVSSDSTSAWIIKPLWSFWRKSEWMLITVMAPEFILAKAWVDLRAAQHNCKKIKAFAAEDRVKWTKAHAYYANMGGFVIEFCPTQAQSTLVETPLEMMNCSAVQQSHVDPSSNKTTDEESMRNKHSDTQNSSQNAAIASTSDSISTFDDSSYHHLVEKTKKDYRPFRSWHSGLDECMALSRLAKHTWVLDASQMLAARELGIISRLPGVTEHEIMDQSKSDILTKTLAMLQIVWLAIRLVTRTFKKLSSSPLEIAALAFGISAIITNILLYNKPKDVEATRRILASRRPRSAAELKKIVFQGPGYLFYQPGNARTDIPNNSIHISSESEPFSFSLDQQQEASYNAFV